MSWSKKIDNRKYAFGSSVNLGIAVFFAYPSLHAMFWLAFMVVVSGINHYATIMVFSKLFEGRLSTNAPVSKGKMAWYLFLKGASLLGGFICLVSFARNVVLQGLALYIFQLIILFLSIKNIGQLLKKGSS